MTKSVHNISYRDLFGKKRVHTATLTISPKKRVVVLSDCHLDHVVDKAQFSKLKKAITECDQLIVNGDFWLDKHISFDEFVASGWSKLFPLMKKKNTVYLFGNHDMPALSDERISLFCNQAAFELKLTIGKTRLHIEHGHLLSTGVVKMVLELFERYPKLLGKVTVPLGVISEMALRSDKTKGLKITKQVNSEYKYKRMSVSGKNEYFVMGHTHVAEFDGKSKFINLGRTHKGDFSYLLLQNNKMELVVVS